MTESPEQHHDDFGGLTRDVTAIVGRRRVLGLLGGAGAVSLLAACRSSSGVTTPTTSAAPRGGGAPLPSDGAADDEGEIPSETNGPYPADGTNGPNVLTTDGIVRGDITGSFGDLTGTAEGVPIRFELTVVDHATGEPLGDHALYIWHCTAAGQYSLYEVTDQNFLRGMQVTDAAGKVSFTSIFPGCYAGRWPHAHFEVYESEATATSGTASLKVTQLALPQAECEAVYADSRYSDSAGNLGRLSLDTDNVFSDGWTDQLAVLSGNPTTGYTATLTVRI